MASDKDDTTHGIENTDLDEAVLDGTIPLSDVLEQPATAESGMYASKEQLEDLQDSESTSLQIETP